MEKSVGEIEKTWQTLWVEERFKKMEMKGGERMREKIKMPVNWGKHKEDVERVQQVQRWKTQRGEKVITSRLSWCFVAYKSAGGEEKAFTVCMCRESQWLNTLQKKTEQEVGKVDDGTAIPPEIAAQKLQLVTMIMNSYPVNSYYSRGLFKCQVLQRFSSSHCLNSSYLGARCSLLDLSLSCIHCKDFSLSASFPSKDLITVSFPKIPKVCFLAVTQLRSKK